MSVTLARRPTGPVERPDDPDGGPGLAQNGDGRGSELPFFSSTYTLQGSLLPQDWGVVSGHSD